MRARLSARRICPSPAIWKEDSATSLTSWRKPSGLRPRRDWLDARSKIRPAIRKGPCMSSAWLSTELRQPRRPHVPWTSPFILTARAHNLMYANPSLEETIKRLQAFQQAGADVLFAPGLPDLDAVRAVCTAVSKPVNFMVGIRGKSFSVAELTGAGVKRISLATSLYRAAMSGLLDALSEIMQKGQFTFLDRCVTTPELHKLMRI